MGTEAAPGAGILGRKVVGSAAVVALGRVALGCERTPSSIPSTHSQLGACCPPSLLPGTSASRGLCPQPYLGVIPHQGGVVGLRVQHRGHHGSPARSEAASVWLLIRMLSVSANCGKADVPGPQPCLCLPAASQGFTGWGSLRYPKGPRISSTINGVPSERSKL